MAGFQIATRTLAPTRCTWAMHLLDLLEHCAHQLVQHRAAGGSAHAGGFGEAAELTAEAARRLAVVRWLDAGHGVVDAALERGRSGAENPHGLFLDEQRVRGVEGQSLDASGEPPAGDSASLVDQVQAVAVVVEARDAGGLKPLEVGVEARDLVTVAVEAAMGRRGSAARAGHGAGGEVAGSNPLGGLVGHGVLLGRIQGDGLSRHGSSSSSSSASGGGAEASQAWGWWCMFHDITVNMVTGRTLPLWALLRIGWAA